MIIHALSDAPRSLLQNRLAVTDKGVSLRSYRLSQIVAGFLRRNPSLLLREIELGKLLMGGEYGNSSARYARVTGDLMRPSRPIEESPHVELLKAYLKDGEHVFSPGLFEETTYYRNAAKSIELYGGYFSVRDPRDIVHRARKFCRMVDGRTFDEHQKGESRPGSPIVVRRIDLSDCYEIVDGHHRLSLASIKGTQKCKCLVEPSEPVLTPLQEMILDCNWMSGRHELYQPISAAEVTNWPVLRRCSDRQAMINRYLENRNLAKGSYLDIFCSYGWFVSRMASNGFQALGVDRDQAAISVGRLALGISDSMTCATDVLEFLNNQKQIYDITSCFSVFHYFVLGAMRVSAAEFIKKIDEVTGSVLFFDMGECHEGWFAESLAGWDAEYIKIWIKNHTSFNNVEILGRDSDNVGVYGNQFHRHLLACTRGGYS